MARKTRKAPLMETTTPDLSNFLYRVAIYTRLSTETQKEIDDSSLARQRQICMDFLKDKPDMVVYDTYMDNGFSGTNFEREDFQRMLDDIATKKVNCVIVKDLSRFGRNYMDVDEYLNEKFPAWKVRFIAVIDHFDTAFPDKDGYLIVPFRNILNEYYAKDFSQKVKTAIEAKMRCGEYVCNAYNIPYGYLRDGENHSFTVNPETAPIVQRIFEMRASGASYYRISTMLNEEGFPSPNRYQYLKGIAHAERYSNVLWSVFTVKAILNNRAYTGCRIHRKSVSGLRGQNRRFTSLDEQIWIPNAHEPLVSEEVFEKVHQLNEETRVTKNNGRLTAAPEQDFRDGFRGRVFCGDCGGRMYFAPYKCVGGKIKLTFRCATHSKYVKACPSHSIQMGKVVAIVENQLNQQAQLVLSSQQIIKQLSDKNDGRIAQKKRNLHSLTVRKNGIAEKKTQLLRDYLEKLIDRDEYFYIKEQYEISAAALEDEMSMVQDEINTLCAVAANAQRLAGILHNYQTSGTLTNELLELLIARLDFYQSGKQVDVKITFNYQDVFTQLLTED